MSADSKRPTFNTLIYDEASEWFVDFRSGDVGPAERQRFAEWLTRSPEHVRAYVELAAIWNEGPRFVGDSQLDEARMLEGARAQANVIPLGPARSTQEPPRAVEKLTARKPGVIFAVAACLAATAVGVGLYSHSLRGFYSTEVGEQRSVTLADGSQVDLNTQTRLRVMSDARQRRVELLEGQALFHVAKDSSRPFVVLSGATQVRAVGTEFVVYRKAEGTTVSVLEGRVAVTAQPTQALAPAPALAGMGELLLAAGEQAVAVHGTAVKSDHPDLNAQTAWTQHQLVFDSVPLIEVAREFNRYNHRRLVIESQDLYNFHITGTFSSSDPTSLLHFLQTRPGIVIRSSDTEIDVSGRP